jgi:hypothetical protein
VDQLAVLTLEHGFSAYIVMGDDAGMIARFAQEVAPALREIAAGERRTKPPQDGKSS